MLLVAVVLMPLLFTGAGAQRPSPVPVVATLHKLQFLESGTHTQLVLTLSRSPEALVVQDEPGKPMTLSFKADSAPGDFPQNRTFNQPNLKGVFIESRNGRIQIFVKRVLPGSVTLTRQNARLTLNMPHLLSQSGTSDKASKPDQELAPGIQHRLLMERLPAGPVRVNVLEIDPQNPSVTITPALASNRMGAKANVAAMVAGNQAVAGINGSFFKQDKGIPLGILIINQELISGPIYDRVAMGITPNNEIVMDRVRLGGEVLLPDRRRVAIHTINQPRVKSNQTVLYTTRWGKQAPPVPQDGLQILIRQDRVAAVSQTESLSIPKDGMVLSGPATPEMLALGSMNPNIPVSLNVYTLPDWSGMKHAVGGGPWLVRNGTPYVDLQAQHFTSRSLGSREPRSAVGVTAQGKLLLVAVDGRHKDVSIGMTLYEMAHLMKKLGAVNAMNLDGGSSTQMSVYGRMINRPSAGSIGVSNALIIKTAPTDTASNPSAPLPVK
ncbi:phosphodiester glycosidase family protein [Vampirovibrio chlorellavorus]|uniref:phosphodiester glycosidase family protein n=1 Tax=Vampirovibrio chlorellavorus TaxID=758823 RepID=UPI0026E9C3CB|nr:phosphodiester glycosidase family protein [Vampirovibrio chlorellavorus]